MVPFDKLEECEDVVVVSRPVQPLEVGVKEHFHIHAAAAAATYITIYGIIISGLLPYMFKLVVGATAARRADVYMETLL